MKFRIFQTNLLFVTVLAAAVACGGNNQPPNGMTATDILTMSRNASASINSSQIYMTATVSAQGATMTMSSFTSQDRLNHTSYYSQNISMPTISFTSYTEIYNFNNSLYIYSDSKAKWIQTRSTVDFWDEEHINDLFQQVDNLSTDVNYLGMETIGGIDCYKISLKFNLASAENILEYFGFNMSELDNINLPDFKCTSWIDENTYDLVKGSITAKMAIEGITTSLNEIITYSNINQPVNIVLPEAAINATVISYSDYASGNY